MNEKYKLIIEYVNALVHHSLHGKAIDEALYAKLINEVYNEKDLISLLDSYLFVVRNESIGAHENKSSEGPNIQMPDEHITNFYTGLKYGLYHKIEDGFNITPTEQQAKFFKYLRKLIEQYETSLLGHKNIMSKLQTSSGNPSAEEVYHMNYIGREITRDTAAMESLKELLLNLDKTKTTSKLH